MQRKGSKTEQHLKDAFASESRAAVGAGLMNLTYNLARIEVLIRLKVFGFDRIGAPRMHGSA